MLHLAANFHNNPAVLELLIREHPLALCVINSFGRTPQQRAIANNRPAAITSLLTDVTNALAASDYAALAASDYAALAASDYAALAALAALVHGDECTFRCLTLTPDHLAVRVSILLSVKHGCVYIHWSKRHCTEDAAGVLDTGLAYEILNDNVWSQVMTFL